MDWSQALNEVKTKEGLDIKNSMEARIVELEEQLKSEIDRKDELLEQQKKVHMFVVQMNQSFIACHLTDTLRSMSCV